MREDITRRSLQHRKISHLLGSVNYNWIYYTTTNRGSGWYTFTKHSVLKFTDLYRMLLPPYMWEFHPILVTLFLVVFGNKVTRILCNSFCIFHLVLPILASEQKTYRKSHNLRDEKPNTKLSKYEMSRALVGRMFLFVTWKTMVKVDFFFIYYCMKNSRKDGLFSQKE